MFPPDVAAGGAYGIATFFAMRGHRGKRAAPPPHWTATAEWRPWSWHNPEVKSARAIHINERMAGRGIFFSISWSRTRVLGTAFPLEFSVVGHAGQLQKRDVFSTACGVEPV